MTPSSQLVRLLKACLSELASNASPLPAGMVLRAGADLIEALSATVVKCESEGAALPERY